MKTRVALLLSFALVIALRAYPNCAFPVSGVTSGVQTINFIPAGNEPFAATLDAIGTWAFGCSGSGYGYPELTTGSYNPAQGIMNVYVFYISGASTDPSGRCGRTDVSISQQTGAIIGATIRMWEHQGNGADCTATMESMVAHEIGHALGLGDVDDMSSCNGTIMGSNPSYVSTDQCDAVNDSWYTVQESSDTGGGGGPDVGHGTCSETICYPPDQGSPILFDIDNDGFHLVGTNDRVPFDLTGDGQPEMITWTRGGKGDAFLAFDRNENGRIDDGTELFGNYTPRVSTGIAAPNGYEALREFDIGTFGGNEDGRLDSADLIWRRLLLWVDRNHDGISQPNELSTLDQSGVIAMETSYIVSHRRDAHGNLFRFKGKAWVVNTAARPHSVPTYDVFFLK